MATFRYYTTQAGQTVELTNVWHDGSTRTTARHFTGLAPDGTRMQAERAIEMKPSPSLHQCGPRCLNATRNLCECSCRGRNHGAGKFTCTPG